MAVTSDLIEVEWETKSAAVWWKWASSWLEMTSKGCSDRSVDLLECDSVSLLWKIAVLVASYQGATNIFTWVSNLRTTLRYQVFSCNTGQVLCLPLSVTTHTCEVQNFNGKRPLRHCIVSYVIIPTGAVVVHGCWGEVCPCSSQNEHCKRTNL